MSNVTIRKDVMLDVLGTSLPESVDFHSHVRVARNPAGVFLSAFGTGISYTAGYRQEGTNVMYGLDKRTLRPVVAASKGDLEFIQKARRVEVNGSGVKARFPYISGQMFPISPKSRDAFTEVDCQMFIDAIKTALPSLDRDDLRYPLNGARVVLGSGELAVFTTDGFKLSVVRIAADGGGLDTWVPYNGLRAAISAFGKDEGVLLVKEESGSVIMRVKTDEVTRQMRVSTGAGYRDSFPATDFLLGSFLPNNMRGATVLAVDSSDFVAALRAVSPMAVSGDNRVLMQVNQNQQLTLSTTQETGGVSALVVEDIDVDVPIRVILSARFLSQVLPRKGQLLIHVKGSKAPVVFEDPENRVVHLIAAMHES